MNKRFGYGQVAKPTWNIRLMGRFEIRGKIRSVDANVINEVKSGLSAASRIFGTLSMLYLMISFMKFTKSTTIS